MVESGTDGEQQQAGALGPRLRDEVISYLGSFVTEQRRERIDRVLEGRTRVLTVLLEDVYRPHNASAVLRSCECFGVQDVHVFEDRNVYSPSQDVALGAAQWLDLIRHRARDGESIGSCCEGLRAAGYRVLAATPQEGATRLDDVEVAGKLAIMLGTEEEGLSASALSAADELVRIPMHGFTESFNVSVCAALMLHQLSSRMRAGREDWALSHDEKQELKLRWYRDSVKRADLLEARYMAERG